MSQPKPPPILPLDIISNILSRLPPKPLLQFKSVSKSFHSLISDPIFVNQHLRHSAASSPYIVIPSSYHHNHTFIPIKSLLFAQEENVDIKFEEFGFCCPHSKIMGSCNGLICVTSVINGDIFVCNPAIRKLRKLPNSSLKEALGFRIGFIYGFGYDEVNDDYCVVMMTSCIRSGYHAREVEIYSLRSNRWRRIGDFPYGPHHENGLSVSGALVWPAMSTTASSTRSVVCGVPVLNFEWKIVAIELGSGRYGEVPQPEGVNALRDKLLGVMDMCLCIFAHFRGTRLEVWMMKEFGVQESWCKVATVPYLVKPCWSDELPFCMPLWYSKNGEMVMLFRSKLVVYNVRDGTFKYRTVRQLNVSTQASTYCESLVSPYL